MSARWRLMPIPPTFRGTSVQVCGFWPFAGGSSRPTIGVPVGQDIETGSTVCCDPFSWFRAGFISSPSMSVFGMPGLGKSSFACRQILGLADRGITSMITDLKSEYSRLVLALGGQVMRFGQGYRMNLLDLGAMGDAARQLRGSRGQQLRELALNRAVDMVITQIQIVRRVPVEDWEHSLLSNAVRALHNRPRIRKAPTLTELAHVLQNPTEEMMRSILVDSLDDYATLTKKLNRSLHAVLEGPLGRMYDGQSTERLRTDVPAVSIDISAVSRQSEAVLASAMLASWSETFGAIEAANALADAGLAPQRHYLTVLDEMWRAMRLEGAGLVDKADSITRLNRNDGVGNMFIAHSLRDMESMTSEADNMKARGFAERSGIVVTAGLAKEDLRALSQVKRMSEIEIATVAGWSTPPGWRPRTVRDTAGRTRPRTPAGGREGADQARRTRRHPNSGEAHPDRAGPARHQRTLARAGRLMAARTVDPTGQKDNLILTVAAVALAAATVGGIWVSLHLAAHLDHTRTPTRDPLRLVVQLVTGRQAWSPTATKVAAALVVLALVLVVGVVLLWPRSRVMRPDRSARHMGRGRGLAHLTAAGAEAKAERLGSIGVGLPIGKTVKGGRMLFSSWEDMLVMIAGPRTQKTTAYAIPAVLAAPGPCLATSNKRDLLDATRGPRSALGEVWVFDPQRVAAARQDFWWDPLSYVERSDTRAEKLAGQFVASARPEGARTDAYFDGEAENLIGLLILAAALAKEPITVVYTWLTRPTADAPADILKEHRFELQHQSLYALSHLPDKQREGVYGTARSLMGWLRNRDILAWVTPNGTGREFSPVRFAADTADTLYLLSREGEGSVGPLVAALTMAVLDAFEERATRVYRGRLTVPFVGVLDEAANICKLRRLDALYSHYGSRGIILFTIVQSWAQAADVWGANGIEKLWSAANVRIYGGGVDDDKFLRRLSDLIGTAEHLIRTSSVSRGHRTLTRAVQDKPILTVAQLRELPTGRAVVFPSGTPAVIIEPQPWFRSKDADAVQASIHAAALADKA